MQVKDQLHRLIHIEKIPQRIISLVPSQTELLCDLGLKDILVGVTKFCVHPVSIRKDVEVVGGTKHIHLDKIKALQPDIIVCNKEENTLEIVEACQTICNVHISDIFTLKDSLTLIHQYGDIFNCKNVALKMVEEIKSEVFDFKLFMENKPIQKVVYFIWKSPWMVAANNTFINYLLKINKFENIYEHKSRYPEVDFYKPSSNNTAAELILLSSEPFPFKESHKTEVEKNYPNSTVILADGEMFSWYGSRLLKAFKYFKTLH